MTVEVLRLAAFTDEGAGGNPAGVVLDASGLTSERMRAIAAEVGYSETSFVVGGSGRELRVRYFSPLAEVAFCGHATVALAVALAERDGVGELTLETPAGEIRVETMTTSRGTLAALTSVPTRSRPLSFGERSALLAALRLGAAELDPLLPTAVAFAGNEHPIVPVATRGALAALDYDSPALEALMRERGWTTVDVVWRESPGRFHARNPFPTGGVREDPATGAAALALGGYLRALPGVETPAEVVIVQGADMGSPSLLELTVDAGQGRSRVRGTAAVIG